MLTSTRQRKSKVVPKPDAPKVLSVDILAQALAMATVKGRLQAKSHPKSANPEYLKRSISATWKSFLPEARALTKKL